MRDTANQTDVLRVEIVKKDSASEARRRDLAQLVIAVLIAGGIAAWVSRQTPDKFSSPAEYFTGLAGCAVFFAAFAAAARALQLVWPNAGFNVSERVMIAGGACWTAMIALTQITVLGIAA